ncbi:tRNA lysidine(34) synthetase TilS [Streptococcus sp. DD13]|uniref:tRNA lysidine(34) synthetase TilS n=1 Tax=Streptococcus sp. DD13 TaxID=1777881 RepID=UPI00082A9570
MQEKFLKVAQDGHFFDKHKKVLVAVSGGKDSMNLLDLLYQFRESLDIELGMVHINHGQREENRTEEDYLERLSRQLHIPFYCAHFKGKFTEENARNFRYDFFRKIMESEGYTALTTAHQADDQAETILMRFIRSTRLRYLSGIPEVRPFGPGELIRPLLRFKKEELSEVFYFEDCSNQTSHYFRNRVRNTLLPLLKDENSNMVDGLLRIGKEVSLYQEAFLNLIQGIDICSVPVFQQSSSAVQSLFLQHYLTEFPDLQVSQEQFDQILGILNHKANYFHSLKGPYFLKKDYDRFEITKIRPKEDEDEDPIVVQFGDVIEQEHLVIGFGTEIPQWDQEFFVLKDLPVCIRQRQAGDQILLNGHHKKLGRYFIDKKVPLRLRNGRIVIEQNHEIYGIVNHISSDLSKQLKNDIMKAKLYIKMKE